MLQTSCPWELTQAKAVGSADLMKCDSNKTVIGWEDHIVHNNTQINYISLNYDGWDSCKNNLTSYK